MTAFIQPKIDSTTRNSQSKRHDFLSMAVQASIETFELFEQSLAKTTNFEKRILLKTR